jgi:hypothetical protein
LTENGREALKMVDRRTSDPEFGKRLIEHQDNTLAAQALKATLAAAGYKYALSLYGIVYNARTDTNNYCRIEVVTRQFWTGDDVTYIKGFFEYIIPVQEYTVWSYDREPKLLKCRGGFH